MKKILGLVLLFILVVGICLVLLMSRSNVGSGNWDLNSPANNSFIASFPALVRANQAAIVASLTPPIEWTGYGSFEYGTASAKLGFISSDGMNDIPAFWLGSVHDEAAQYPSVRYFLGPQLEVPSNSSFGSFSGWEVRIASDTGGTRTMYIIPPFGVSNFLSISDNNLYVGGSRKITGLATGTTAQHAVNVGQMSASISYALNNLATGTDNTDAVNVGQLYETVGRGYDVYAWRESFIIPDDGIATFVEILDSGNLFNVATFTAPQLGWYEVELFGNLNASAMSTPSVRIVLDLYEDSNFNPLELYSNLLSVSIDNSSPNSIKSIQAKSILYLNPSDTIVPRWLGGNPSVVGTMQITIKRMRKAGEIY